MGVRNETCDVEYKSRYKQMDLVTDHPVTVSLLKSRLQLDARDGWAFRQALHGDQLLMNCRRVGDFVVDFAARTISRPPTAPTGLENCGRQRILGTDTEYMYYRTVNGKIVCYLDTGALQWTVQNLATEMLFFKASDGRYSGLTRWSRLTSEKIPIDWSKGGAIIQTYKVEYFRGVDLYYTGGPAEGIPILERTRLTPLSKYLPVETECDLTLCASRDGTRAFYSVHAKNSDHIVFFRLWNLVDPAGWTKFLRFPETLGENFNHPGWYLYAGKIKSVGNIKPSICLAEDNKTMFACNGPNVFRFKFSFRSDTAPILTKSDNDSQFASTLVEKDGVLLVGSTTNRMSKPDASYLYNLKTAEISVLTHVAYEQFITITSSGQVVSIMEESYSSSDVGLYLNGNPRSFHLAAVTRNGRLYDTGVVVADVASDDGASEGDGPYWGKQTYVSVTYSEGLVDGPHSEFQYTPGIDGYVISPDGLTALIYSSGDDTFRLYDSAVHSKNVYADIVSRNGSDLDARDLEIAQRVMRIRAYCDVVGTRDKRCLCLDVPGMRDTLGMSDSRFDRFEPTITCLVGTCNAERAQGTVLGAYLGRTSCAATSICIQDINLNLSNSSVGGNIALNSSCGNLMDDPLPSDTVSPQFLEYPPTRLTAQTTTIEGEPHGNGVYVIGGTMALVFDTKFMSGTAVPGETTVSWQLELPVRIRLNSYALYVRETDQALASATTWQHDPKSWILYGSIDGTGDDNWVELDREENRTTNSRIRRSTLDIAPLDTYRVFRLVVTETQDGNLERAHIGAVTFYGTADRGGGGPDVDGDGGEGGTDADDDGGDDGSGMNLLIFGIVGGLFGAVVLAILGFYGWRAYRNRNVHVNTLQVST